jgi:hypothetical protein
MILPEYFVASPKHPLMSELKNLTCFSDPVNISTESSRDLFYQHSTIFNTSLIYDFFSKINYNFSGIPINTNLLTSYVLTYFTGFYNTNNLVRN